MALRRRCSLGQSQLKADRSRIAATATNTISAGAEIQAHKFCSENEVLSPLHHCLITVHLATNVKSVPDINTRKCNSFEKRREGTLGPISI